ncbi:MAG TPA: hypothetical protein VMB47_02385 [Candidatus Aquilonibacter sp.]|nr:hypothetical protein [Candidatus Aquilonibacter sp.]
MATTAPPTSQETEIIEELKAERTASTDGRRRRRLNVSLPVHVRPFDTRFAEIEDVGEVQNFTRDGLYFVTCMPHYFKEMRLIVTFPFGDNVSAHRRFLGEIVRLEERQKGTTGIAVKFLL